MAVGNIVRIFNRTPYVLTATKDGRQFPIKPGYNHVTSDIVFFARAQNPVMGTEDPGTLEYESLISRVANADEGEEQIDSLEPIPADILALMPRERINRMLLDTERQKGVEERSTSFPSRNVRQEEANRPGVVDPGAAWGADN